MSAVDADYKNDDTGAAAVSDRPPPSVLSYLVQSDGPGHAGLVRVPILG